MKALRNPLFVVLALFGLSWMSGCESAELPTAPEETSAYAAKALGAENQHSAAPSLHATLASATTYTNPIDFQTAIAGLETPTVIDFEDIDASPVNNTYVGRDPFDGNTYANKGIIFSNPNAYLLYIAPGGLFWNASNSLSVRQFPFDSNAADDTDDDLVVSLIPPATAVGFTLVDNYTFQQDEFVQFIDPIGDVVQQVTFPSDFTPFRAFLGIVSVDRPIAKINIVEAANDGDDVDYDDFIFIPTGKVTICHKPGTPAQKTLVIPIQALPGHLGHGDTIGSCN